MAKSISELSDMGGGELSGKALFHSIPLDTAGNPISDTDPKNLGIWDRKITYKELLAFVRNIIANKGDVDFNITKPYEDLTQGLSPLVADLQSGEAGALTTLVSALNKEYARARDVESDGKALDDTGVLPDGFDTDSLAAAITYEYDRAMEIESGGEPLGEVLPEEIEDSNLAAALKNEYLRAKGVEGALTNLDTAAKDSLVLAINDIQGQVGKTDASGLRLAINQLAGSDITQNGDITSLKNFTQSANPSALNTTAKQLVSAINEVLAAITQEVEDRGAAITSAVSAHNGAPDAHADILQAISTEISDENGRATVRENEIAALIPSALPSVDGTYNLSVVGGIPSWELV